jgi:quinol monooxygenase YgiN
MIHVVALITAKPGMRGEVLAAFRANRPNVLAEKGCIEYVSVVDADGAGTLQTPVGSDTFIVIEKWDSLESLKTHASAKHMAAYAKQVSGLLADRVIHVLNPVSY